MSKNQYLEIIGLVLNVLSVYYVIKKKPINWIIGIAAIMPLLYIFYETKLYGQFIVQIAYLLQSVYGYYEWMKYKECKETKMIRFRFEFDFEPLLFISLACVPFMFMGMEGLDFLLFYMSMLAIWMLTKRLIENWLVFIVIDLLSVVLFVKDKIYITALLYFIFLIMAIIGYYSWNKSLIKQKQ
jgi:nicotinamide mononucleotide transporter